jgi:hypothetical protein
MAFTSEEVEQVRGMLREQTALIVNGGTSPREGASRISAAAASIHGDAVLIDSPLWEDVAPFFIATDQWETSEAFTPLVPADLQAEFEETIRNAARDYVGRERAR